MSSCLLGLYSFHLLIIRLIQYVLIVLADTVSTIRNACLTRSSLAQSLHAALISCISLHSTSLDSFTRDSSMCTRVSMTASAAIDIRRREREKDRKRKAVRGTLLVFRRYRVVKPIHSRLVFSCGIDEPNNQLPCFLDVLIHF